MNTTSDDWEQRIADLWASLDDLSEQTFLAKIEALVAELPADSFPSGWRHWT